MSRHIFIHTGYVNTDEVDITTSVPDHVDDALKSSDKHLPRYRDDHVDVNIAWAETDFDSRRIGVIGVVSKDANRSNRSGVHNLSSRNETGSSGSFDLLMHSFYFLRHS